ncbi:DUF7544 domain-containing protein [Haloarcula pelagica]|uniref:DUF7544 domain-containing protein n=1 Tax=Haloarcula pelagica TaxID=3033389 RepID=UPI0024C3E84C|nr:hypothetical protein [Halomicroarcula sp. YJ-61-S]
MTLHAVDDIDEAIDATKSFLFPFELRQWLRMALVVFFIGGGTGTGGVQNIGQFSNFGDEGSPSAGEFSLTAPLESVPAVPGPGRLFQVGGRVPAEPSSLANEVGAAVLIAAVAAVVVLALVFAYLGAVMEFALAQSLIDQEVHVRRYLRRHAGNGLWLFGFRVVLGVASLVVLISGLAALYVVAGGSFQNPSASVLLGSLGLVIVAVVGFAVVYGLINGFTNVFVVPMIVERGDGLVGGWKRLWGSMRREPKQYLVYVFFSVVLAIGVGIVGGIAGFVAALIIAIPFGLVGLLLGFGLATVSQAAGIAGGAVVFVLYLLVLLVVANMIKAPLQTFLRYYAMLVLGDIDEGLDPIPEVRGALRSDEAA